MKKITFIAEAGRVGRDGTQIDLKGINTVGSGKYGARVSNDFGEFLGWAEVTITPEGIVAEATIEVIEKPIVGWPAVVVAVISSETNAEGVRVITSSNLRGISISSNPNADPLIGKIEI
jgi:hypothetical protein